MSTYTKQKLSGSTAGRPVSINDTAAPGTVIHTCAATAAGDVEEVGLWAWNNATGDATFNLYWGGTASGQRMLFTVPAQTGIYPVSPGWPLTATTAIIYGYSTATDIIIVGGYVNRVT